MAVADLVVKDKGPVSRAFAGRLVRGVNQARASRERKQDCRRPYSAAPPARTSRWPGDKSTCHERKKGREGRKEESKGRHKDGERNGPEVLKREERKGMQSGETEQKKEEAGPPTTGEAKQLGQRRVPRPPGKARSGASRWPSLARTRSIQRPLRHDQRPERRRTARHPRRTNGAPPVKGGRLPASPLVYSATGVPHPFCNLVLIEQLTGGLSHRLRQQRGRCWSRRRTRSPRARPSPAPGAGTRRVEARGPALRGSARGGRKGP